MPAINNITGIRGVKNVIFKSVDFMLNRLSDFNTLSNYFI